MGLSCNLGLYGSTWRFTLWKYHLKFHENNRYTIISKTYNRACQTNGWFVSEKCS